MTDDDILTILSATTRFINDLETRIHYTDPHRPTHEALVALSDATRTAISTSAKRHWESIRAAP